MTSPVLMGQLNWLLIAGNSAQFEMNNLEGVREKLQLWFDVDAVIPDRVTQSMWVSLCREGLIHGSELLVATAAGSSARVLSIRISLAPPLPDSLAAALHQLL